MSSEKMGEIEDFDRWSATYERSAGQGFFVRAHKAALDTVASYARGAGPGSVLDIGCATGRLLRQANLLWPKARLFGVDPSEGMIEVARGLAPGASFIVGLAEALPLPDSSIDVALSTLSFHHWGNMMAGLREVRRVLRPGGHFCMADVNLPRVLAAVIRHFGSRTSDELRSMFERAGLHVVAQRRTFARVVLVVLAEKK
jgi:ubiquinone/menaquinone biosynthesis C-methylase UbiE